PRTGIALALMLAASAAPASAGTWTSLTAPQANWDQPFSLGYDVAGNLYANTFATGGPASLFVRPAAGGAFGSALTPIAGNGPTVMAQSSDDLGRVQFVAGRAPNVKYRRRGVGGMFA